MRRMALSPSGLARCHPHFAGNSREFVHEDAPVFIFLDGLSVLFRQGIVPGVQLHIPARGSRMSHLSVREGHVPVLTLVVLKERQAALRVMQR